MVGVHRSCPNKDAEGCTWRSLEVAKITTKEETQALTMAHCVVCPTIPAVKIEHLKDTEHRWQATAPATAAAAAAVPREAPLKPQPLARPALETEMALEDYDLFLSKW